MIFVLFHFSSSSYSAHWRVVVKDSPIFYAVFLQWFQFSGLTLRALIDFVKYGSNQDCNICIVSYCITVASMILVCLFIFLRKSKNRYNIVAILNWYSVDIDNNFSVVLFAKML